ncbi:hypothetical protein ACFQ0M_00450 [Kitasatospora aburaviensis]|uniref:Secreted protein n=1 Tax=Kitasatospora aburaviensis TaxID=67265 RepID=A0ABW1F4D2_9ACTN
MKRVVAAFAGLAAALTFSIAAEGTAAADDFSLRTYSSTKGGYGTAFVSMSGDTYRVRVCDRGPADGYRVVVRLTKGAFQYTAHAAGGSGTCGGFGDGDTNGWLPSPQAGTYTFEVCLRNGPGGMDFNCNKMNFYFLG